MTPTTAEAAGYYARLQVQTAGMPKKIVMLHSRCSELIAMAIDETDSQKRRFLCNRAQNILAQLQSALMVDDNVSQSLFYLYDYSYAVLERGEDSDLSNALSIVGHLRDTFEELLYRQ
jgi:flagellar biosynthetic protein FliS